MFVDAADKNLRRIGPVKANNAPTDFHYVLRIDSSKKGVLRAKYVTTENVSIHSAHAAGLRGKEKMRNIGYLLELRDYMEENGLTEIDTGRARRILADKANCSPSTIKNHLTGLLTPVKRGRNSVYELTDEAFEALKNYTT
jgi:hypothetical protein